MTKTLYLQADTTGAYLFREAIDHPDQPHLLRLAWAIADESKILSTRCLLIKPADTWVIEPDAIVAHGVTRDLATRSGVLLPAALTTFIAALDTVPRVVAYNIDFHRRVVERAAMDAGLNWEHLFSEQRMDCAMRRATDVVKKPRMAPGGGFLWPKFAEAYRFFSDQNPPPMDMDPIERGIALVKCIHLIDRGILNFHRSTHMSDPFGQERPRNPFGNGQEVATRPVAALGALASAEQQRALGELQAQIMLAKTYPRDPQQAVDNILRDCSRVSLAQVAQYEFARAGTSISGPSIKLMEAIARRWGNMTSGFKVLNSENGASEVVCYAWDIETGFRDERQFRVHHIRDTRKGPVKLTDERDIYELIANNAQRRKRACLIAVIPADVVEAAVEQCQETLNANVDTSVEGLKKLLKAFNEFGVTQAQIEQRIQSKLEAISPGQVTQLSKIYLSLKDGMSVPSQWFRAADPPRQPPAGRQQQPAPPPPPPAAPPSSTPGETTVLVQNRQDHRAPHGDNLGFSAPENDDNRDVLPESGGIMGTQEELAPDAFPSADNPAFEYVVMDPYGAPIDGELHLDPLAWAQQFLAAWSGTGERDNLLHHNADALADARAMSPEADALLDGLDADQEQAETAGENRVPPPPRPSEDDLLATEILARLPTLATPMEVIEFSKSAPVMGTIQRWLGEGQTERVTSVRTAFTTRLGVLKAAANG